MVAIIVDDQRIEIAEVCFRGQSSIIYSVFFYQIWILQVLLLTVFNLLKSILKLLSPWRLTVITAIIMAQVFSYSLLFEW